MTEETKATGEIVDVTPIFNYTRDITIIKRFVEQVTRLSGDDHLGSEALAYIRTNLPWARQAISSLMADDIKWQIASGIFPLREPVITFHEFKPDPIDKDVCINGPCYTFKTADIHL